MPMRRVLLAIGLCGLACSAMAQEPAPMWSPEGQLPAPYTGDEVYQPSQMPVAENSQFFPAPDLSQAPPIPQSWLSGLWDPQPFFEARFELMFLRPDLPSSVKLANTYLLDQDGLAYTACPVRISNKEDYVASGRAVLEFHLNPYYSIEAGGFISDGPDWNSRRLMDTDAPYYLDANSPIRMYTGFLSNIPAGFPVIADQMTIDWDFEAFGGETSFLRHFIMAEGPASDLAVGVGIRYLGIRENLRLTVNDYANNLTGIMAVNSKNDLIGPQLQARARLQTPWKRMRVVAEGKIGLMGNKSNNQTFISPDSGGESGANYGRTQFAPLYEGIFRVEFFIFEHLTLFGGFDMLYVSRVDRASSQFTQNLDVFVQDHKDLSHLFSFGPTCGFLFTY
ncbi:MAG: hypothetical protein U1D30_23690 [Planctomycetota bacterium]